MCDEELLVECLAEIERSGLDPDRWLRAHPDLPEPVRAALAASGWLGRAPRPVPSTEFRSRAKQRFVEQVVAERGRPTPPLRYLDRLMPRLRPALVPLAAVLALSIGMTSVFNASAAALPDSPLYPAKLAFEQIREITALTPQQKAEVHLAVANERLREATAEARAGNVTVASQLVDRYDGEVQQAKRVEPSVAAPAIADVRRDLAQVEATEARVSPTAAATAGRETEVPRAAPLEAPARPREIARAAVATAPSRAGEVSGRAPNPTATSATAAMIASAAASAATSESTATSAPARVMANPAGNAAGNAAPNVAAPSPTAVPTSPTPAPAADSPDVTLRQLIRQVQDGDPGAAATLQQFIASVSSTKAAGDGWSRHLLAERSQLEFALPRVSPAGRSILQQAIAAIDNALAPADSGSGQATSQSVASPTPSPAGPLRRGGPGRGLWDQSAPGRGP